MPLRGPVSFRAVRFLRCVEIGLFQHNRPKVNITICQVASLLRMSAACRAPGFCSVGDIVWARIAKASIASQNIASAVTVFERAILAVPIGAACTVLDYRTPRGLVSLSRLQSDIHTDKSRDGS